MPWNHSDEPARFPIERNQAHPAPHEPSCLLGGTLPHENGCVIAFVEFTLFSWQANFKRGNIPSREFVPAGVGEPSQAEGAPLRTAVGRDPPEIVLRIIQR
jgi:hypothetical protein